VAQASPTTPGAALPPALVTAFAQTPGLTLAELAQALGQSVPATRTWLEAQLAQGHVRREGRTNGTRYYRG